MNPDDLLKKKEEKHLSVVRLRTGYWYDNSGVHIRRDITFQRRLSNSPYHLLEEEASNAGADLAVKSIKNLNECPDGLYLVEMINVQKDWETGYVDSYYFKLVPFRPLTGDGGVG